MERLVYFYEDIELWEIQVCERILVLCSPDVLLYDKLHAVIVQLMPYPAYAFRVCTIFCKGKRKRTQPNLFTSLL